MSLSLNSFYKRIKVKNKRVLEADAPMILALNHPNAFMDPVVFSLVVYPPKFKYLARGDAFKPGIAAYLLESLGLAPIYRIQDGGKEGLQKNSETYDRVNYFLREIRGFTYGVRGGFAGGKYPGPYTISGGFRANSTDSTLIDMISELKKYTANGVTEDELSFTKNAMAQSDALKYESAFQKLGFIKRILDFNLDKNYVKQQGDILNNITKADIDARAKKHLPLDNMLILVVGDKATNFDKVKALGYEVVELDLNGNPVK